MAKNFEKTTKGEVGDIIPPAYNGTNGFWNKPKWDLITRVDIDNNILDVMYIWDIATVKAIELIQLLFDKELEQIDHTLKLIEDL